MTPLDFIFWAVEMILEGIGAEFSFKRRIWPLYVYLLFRVAADSFCFAIFWKYGQNAFYWCDWWQRAIQYPLMGFLLAWTISRLLKEHDGPPLGARFFISLTFLFAAWRFPEPLTSTNLMRFELGANMILAGMLCLALAMRKEVKAPWGAISAGILIQVGSEAVLTLGLLKGLDTSKYYSVFATIALVTWCVAVRPKFKLKEARLPLGVR